jgi:hypothetical protein
VVAAAAARQRAKGATAGQVGSRPVEAVAAVLLVRLFSDLAMAGLGATGG